MHLLLTLFYSIATISVLIISNIPILKDIFFPYGKTLIDHDGKYLVPKFWFLHFYIIGMFSTLMAIVWKWDQTPIVTVIFLIHCFRRFCECLVSHRSESKMHITHYMIGILYYLLTSWAWDELPAKNLWLGGSLWLFGTVEQIKAHSYLRQLHQSKLNYPLPSQRYFSNTACPHYFFEMVLNLGMAIMSQFHFISLLVLIWVIVDLHLSATEQWKWYKKRYETPQRFKKWIPSLI